MFGHVKRNVKLHQGVAGTVYDETTDTWKPAEQSRTRGKPRSISWDSDRPPPPPSAPQPRRYSTSPPGRHNSSSQVAPEGRGATPDEVRLVRVLTETVTRMEEVQGSPDAWERSEAITALSRLIETAYGDDAAMIGDFMRECGGVELLIEYLEDESSDVQQRALMVLGNLVSDAVDPEASRTKQLFVRADGGCDALLPLLEAPDWVTQMYL